MLFAALAAPGPINRRRFAAIYRAAFGETPSTTPVAGRSRACDGAAAESA
jgi:hypothetical protein